MRQPCSSEEVYGSRYPEKDGAGSRWSIKFKLSEDIAFVLLVM